MAPNNDLFARAIFLTGNAFHTEGSNVDATGETGEPNHAGVSLGYSTGTLESVWWKWTAPTSGSVSLTTFGSNYDTTLAVYTGSAIDRLTSIASMDDFYSDNFYSLQSGVSFSVIAGKTYRIAVDGFSDSNGSIQLTLNYNGTLSNDTFAGTPYGDLYYGRAGNDVINGNGGPDVLFGEAGNDQITGSVFGGEMLDGGPGDDTIHGNGGDGDSLIGGTGNDVITGGSGYDFINAGNGNNTIHGNGGDDYIWSESGADLITGGSGSENIYSGGGNDTIYGNGGNDWINSGTGNDTVYLGSGNATVFLSTGSGSDRIFNLQTNRLQLEYGVTFDDLTIVGVGSDTHIRLDSDLLAIVVGTQPSIVANPDNFVFW